CHPPHRARAVEARERGAHRIGAVGGRPDRRAPWPGPPDLASRRPRARPLRAVEGARGPGRLCRARAARVAPDGAARHVLRRRKRPRGPSRARAGGDRLLHRVARPWSVLRSGRRARRAHAAPRPARVRVAERCRVQRGIGVGGRHVRGAPPALEPRRAHRPEWPAGARLHGRRAVAVSDGGSLASVRVGRARGRRPRRGRTRREDRPPRHDGGAAPRPGGTHRLRQGRLVHGTPDQVALQPDVRRRVPPRARRDRGAGAERMRGAFVRTLTEIAAEDARILLLTGDLGYMALEPFSERFPDRFLNVGVAEQNMVGTATGLAEAGFIPFVYSIVTFATLRPYEFIRNGPVWHRLPVRIVGVGGGFEYGPQGV